MPFTVDIDIANRACQHMGVRQISPTLGFNEDSLQANELGECYDKLRVAELRRALWRYSVRRAVLRPVSVNTMLLKPPLWSSTTTYFPGAIVTLEDGTLWFSTTQGNIANPPAGSAAWDGYFGAMTADPFDSDEGYQAGDVVFTVPANGVPSVFLSLENGNSDDPATATEWSLLSSAGATQYYFKDQVVSHSGTSYQSLIDLNTGNTPGLAAAIWAVATTYAAAAQVTGSNGVIYTSLAAGNVGHDPVSSPTYWEASGLSSPAAWAGGTTYGIGDQVVASDGIIYASATAANAGNDPSRGQSATNWTNTGAYAPWTTTITNGTGGSMKWAKIDVALEKLTFAYPVGSGPVEQSETRNVFHLPAGYLRQAPQTPKAGGVSFLGGPSGASYSDWEYEGDYIITRDARAIMFRFGANIRSVTAMDPLFCEGLAARCGLECVERVTQSNAKYQKIAAAYQKFMGDARQVNAIELGPVEAPEDDFIACRI